MVVLEGEEIDAQLKFVFDSGDLVVGDWVWDLIQTLFGEQRVVPERTLRIFGARVKGRQDRISKAAVVSILDVDDCLFLGQEVWQLSELETGERQVIHNLDVSL